MGDLFGPCPYGRGFFIRPIGLDWIRLTLIRKALKENTEDSIWLPSYKNIINCEFDSLTDNAKKYLHPEVEKNNPGLRPGLNRDSL